MKKRQEPERHDSPQSADSPWSEPLPGESSKAFAQFRQYRDLGAKRSFTNIAKTSNISVSAVAQMALKYRWRDRVFEFDWHEQKQVEMALARERKQARERAIQISMAMQALATRGLVELQRKIERGEALNMSVSEMVAMAALGEKLVRQSLGEDPDRTFTKISVIMNGGEPYEPTPPKDPETVN